MTAVTVEKRRPGRPRTDTDPVGIVRDCSRCKRTMDLAAWSPGNRAKTNAPCRSCASALTRSWAARHPKRVRATAKRWRRAHQPLRPAKPTCQRGHKIVWVKATYRWVCMTCRDERRRAQSRRWRERIKNDPIQLERKRAADRAYRRQRNEQARQARASLPSKPTREQPDGTWTCLGCGACKPPDEFHRKQNGRPESRCKPCYRARQRQSWATRRADAATG